MKIIADSLNYYGTRLTTFLISIPTCLLAELRTHRLLRWSDSDFSINANSDRAIPVNKKLERLKTDFYLPIETLAQKGMSGKEDVPLELRTKAQEIWIKSKDSAIEYSKTLLDLGLHKQYINRILMPYSMSDVVITGDYIAFNNFFKLRTTKETEPNFRKIAIEMYELYKNNIPENTNLHIAFKKEIDANYGNLLQQQKEEIRNNIYYIISSSMCARISYNIQAIEDLNKHKERVKMCYNNGHYSIFEHQAREIEKENRFKKEYWSNVSDWILLRKDFELKNKVINFD